MAKSMSFGEYLREHRLKCGVGLRAFAEAIEMQPSNLSNIEHRRIAPPQDVAVIGRMAEMLGMAEGSKERERLYDLAVAHKKDALPADVATFAARTPGIPVILRTVKNRKLTEKEIGDLAEYVNRRFKK
jgi:transcriptional regulator with XRE-family HTH domain